MKNKLLLNSAIELLQGVNPDELETVQINHTKYDDGSIGFAVELTYPEEMTNSSILRVNGKEIGKLVEPHVTKIQQAKKERNDTFRGFTKPEGSV